MSDPVNKASEFLADALGTEQARKAGQEVAAFHAALLDGGTLEGDDAVALTTEWMGYRFGCWGAEADDE